jgi:TetR/AcrR family transcriptional repressor of nem operon
MVKRPKHTEETRQRLVQAAFEEFYRNGFQGGSLNHIVQAAGTTKGALFHHFQGKQALGYTVVEEVIGPLVRNDWIVPANQSDNPVRDLKRLLSRVRKHGLANGSLSQGCPLNNLAQEMSPLDEGFRRRIETIYDAWRDDLAAAFKRGIEAGHVRKDVIPRQVAVFFVAAIAGIIGAAKNAQSEDLMKEALDALIEYLNGLKA